MEARFRKECKQCSYFSRMHQFGVCDYLLKAGKRRKQKVEDCEEWKNEPRLAERGRRWMI